MIETPKEKSLRSARLLLGELDEELDHIEMRPARRALLKQKLAHVWRYVERACCGGQS